MLLHTYVGIRSILSCRVAVAVTLQKERKKGAKKLSFSFNETKKPRKLEISLDGERRKTNLVQQSFLTASDAKDAGI